MYATNVFAADITVTITIKDVYVPRLVTMVNDLYMPKSGCEEGSCGDCEGLTVKQCFEKKMIIEKVKSELLHYERVKARRAAADAASAGITEIEINQN